MWYFIVSKSYKYESKIMPYFLAYAFFNIRGIGWLSTAFYLANDFCSLLGAIKFNIILICRALLINETDTLDIKTHKSRLE